MVFINDLTEKGESLYQLEAVGKFHFREIKDRHYSVGKQE